MTDLVVKADGLSKKFVLREKDANAPRLLDIFRSMFGLRERSQKTTHDFWALKDISFELKRGENLGIVGLNGAGKSTLLKVLLKRLYPDRGSFKVFGSSGGLIELGAGFHPEHTGRKNIRLNAMMLGISQAEIASKIDDIIEFAEIGEFIDMPVKTYSSGMAIRLGFSVAIHFVKDLIICDEILAVGDFEFKQKCYKRIHELKKSRSFILVSHGTKDISLFCDKALFLHKGECVAYGNVDDVIEKYSFASNDVSVDQIIQKIKKGRKKKSESNVVRTDNLLNCVTFSEVEEIRIAKFGRIFCDSEAVSDIVVLSNCELDKGELYANNNESLTIAIQFCVNIEIAHLRIGLPFFSEEGVMVIGPDSRQISPKNVAITCMGTKTVEFHFEKMPVNEGRYMLVLALSSDPGYLYRNHIGWLNVKNVTSEFGLVRSTPSVSVDVHN